MSKQSDAKEKQGYVAKAVPRTCSMCARFTKDTETKSSVWVGETYTVDSNLRCSIGGFAVKKWPHVICGIPNPELAARLCIAQH